LVEAGNVSIVEVIFVESVTLSLLRDLFFILLFCLCQLQLYFCCYLKAWLPFN